MPPNRMLKDYCALHLMRRQCSKPAWTRLYAAFAALRSNASIAARRVSNRGLSAFVRDVFLPPAGALPRAATLAACLAVSWPALAAPAPASAPAAASSANVLTVNADSSSAATTDNNQTDVVYSGHVVIHRGQLTLHGDRAVIHLKAQKIDTVLVTGQPARFTLQTPDKPTIKGSALSVTYHAADNTLDLDDQVHFSRPGEHFSADHLRYQINTRRLDAHGKNHGRVHAVLTPASGSSQ